MTLSDSQTGVTVSSWGWLNYDGQPISRDRAQFRLWSIRTDKCTKRAGFIALPVETEDMQVLSAAIKMFSTAIEFEQIPVNQKQGDK